VDEPLPPTVLADPDALAAVLARQRPAWPPGERHGYHALSLGFYESALLRIVDPAHRTLGRYFRDEVAGPLGLAFHIGLPDGVPPARVATLEAFPLWRVATGLDRDSWRTVRAVLTPGSLAARAFRNPRVRGPDDLAGPRARGAEFPAVGGWGIVRDIARAYGVLATGGAALGLWPETLHELRTPAPVPARGDRDAVLRVRTRYACGFLKPSPDFRFGTNDAAFGTMGAGGSFAFADPDAGLGFAYAMNRMGFHVWSDPRERALREAVYRCL
jgi:CubicO group peptidase (beta-lactamase class C family)